MRTYSVGLKTMPSISANSEYRRPSFSYRQTDNSRLLDAHEINRFHEQGCLKITSVTAPSDIAEVGTIIDQIYAHFGRKYGSIDNLVEFAPELKASGAFRSCLFIAKQLLGRTTMFACDSALYKEPHGKHGTPWHQDGAFHGNYFPNNTISFWIPLQDVTPGNGCLHFIPLERRQILLPHRPYYPNDKRSLMTDHVKESHAIPFPLSVGDASVHGPLTLHSAPPNSTDSIRRTWLLTFRPWGRWGSLAPSRVLQRAKLIRDRFMYMQK